jgi:hypothetical protein
MQLTQLFLSIVMGCDPKTTDSSEPVVNDIDCGEWGDCYGICMEPYNSENTWTVPADDFATYLDADGQLTTEQCFAICTDYFTEYNWGGVIEYTSCVDDGSDDNGDQSITCGYLLSPYCEGRKHNSIDAHLQVGNDIDSWFVRATQAEIGSVGAFLIMREELRKMGAPKNLISQCLTAAQDEIKHARMMHTVCVSLGQKATAPTIDCVPKRSYFSLAMENAIEGCIHESYAAIQALYQSQHAKTPELRELFTAIATDEIQHAQLSLQIHHWLMSKLTREQQNTILKAQQKSVGQLIEYHTTHEPAAQTSILGLPDSKSAVKMTQTLFASLTSEWKKVA